MSLINILQKKRKTLEEAQFIHHKLLEMAFFKGFYSRNLKIFTHEHLLYLFQLLEYEQIPSGNYLFEKGETADKFYVLLSGQAAIIEPNEKPSFMRKSSSKQLLTYSDNNTPIIPQLKIDVKVDSSNVLQDLSTDRFIRSQRSSRPDSPIFQRPKNVCQTVSPKTYGKFLEEKLKMNGRSLTKLPDNPSPMLNKEEKQTKPQELNLFDDLFNHEKSKEYDSDLRRSVFYINEGESLGELALTTDLQRSASVVCKTDCEFLVLTKQQFELLKMRRDREKEDFLKAIFPFLNNETMSSFNYARILTSFQTEVFNKGTFITREGKVLTSDPKFYLVSQGECIVEKNLPLTEKSQSIQIAVIAKGTLIGEEILMTQDEYNYTVKVTTDTLVVHSMSSKFLELEFCKFFKNEVIKMHEKKKKQRDLIFEKSKKEYEIRSGITNNANTLRATQLNLFVSRTPVPKKEAKILNEISFKFPKIPRDLSKQESKTANVTIDNDRFSPDSSSSGIFTQTVQSRKKILRMLESKNFQKNQIESKIDFLSKLSTPRKEVADSFKTSEVYQIKLFKSRKSIKGTTSSSPKCPVVGASSNNTNHWPLKSKKSYEHGKSVFNEFAKISAKFNQLDQDLIDIKCPQKVESSTTDVVSLQFLSGPSNPPSPTEDLKKFVSDEINTGRTHQPTFPSLRSFNTPIDGLQEYPSCNEQYLQDKNRNGLPKKTAAYAIFNSSGTGEHLDQKQVLNLNENPKDLKDKYRTLRVKSKPILNKLTLELDVKNSEGLNFCGKTNYGCSLSPLPNTTTRSFNLSPIPRLHANHSATLSPKIDYHKLHKKGHQKTKSTGKRVSIKPIAL